MHMIIFASHKCYKQNACVHMAVLLCTRERERMNMNENPGRPKEGVFELSSAGPQGQGACFRKWG